jgi:hypothetical protein
MPKEREVTRIYKLKPFASRPIERPKNRWEDDVRKDWLTVEIKNWKRSVLNRDLWKAIVERTKTAIELWRISRRRRRRRRKRRRRLRKISVSLKMAHVATLVRVFGGVVHMLGYDYITCGFDLW